LLELIDLLVTNLQKFSGWSRQAPNARCVVPLIKLTLIYSGNAKCDACRAEPQNCWLKKGRRKRPQQSPRNETQVQA